MKTNIENRSAKVQRGFIELIVPYKDSELTFVYPAKGPNTYIEVGNQIEQSGLIRPTSEETVHLVHLAYFDDNVKDEPEFNDIRGIMKNKWFWEFTRNLWVEDGVYVYDNRDGKLVDESDLIKKLEANDRSVRFVPKGFKLGEQTSEELAKNPYIIARYSEEGAEKLAEVAGQFSSNPYVYGLTNVRKSEQRVSALGHYWGRDRLGVGGSDFVGVSGGYALGVRESGEATRAEKKAII